MGKKCIINNYCPSTNSCVFVYVCLRACMTVSCCVLLQSVLPFEKYFDLFIIICMKIRFQFVKNLELVINRLHEKKLISSKRVKKYNQKPEKSVLCCLSLRRMTDA